MKNRFFLLLALGVVTVCLSCSIGNTAPNAAAAPSAQPEAKTIAAAAAASATPDPTRVAECVKVQPSGKVVFKNQSFAFDAKPFEGSCFVTYADKEQMVDSTDIARGSTFHIVKNGKIVYDFPNAFDMDGCWVEGVGFSDLNGDGLTDVIIAGSCLGAKASYPANAIYLNNGSDFTVKKAADNPKFQDLKSVKAIEAYVKAHPKSFF